MTNAIATRPQQGITARVDVLEGVTFADLVGMGEQLARTGFLPDHIKTGPQFAAIVMTGRELGMAPMRAIRSFHMVKGKVVEDAASQLARFKSAGGRATFDHLDDVKAVLTLTHPNGDKHTETWTIEDAKKAGLTSGLVGKFPRAMMRSRVITAGLKSLGWEGAVGAYDPSELVESHDDPEPMPARVVEVLPPAPKGPAEEVRRILDLADMIRSATGDEEVAYAAGQIEEVTSAVADEAKRNGYRFALDALASQSSARIVGVEWEPTEKQAASVAKIGALVDKMKAGA
jgi:hypothetical protein